MIVFEDTGEVCVLIGRCDTAERRSGKAGTFPNTAWDIHWTQDWADGGPWQKFLSVPPKYVESVGVSAMNLFNRLSFRRAIKEGGVIKVKKLP